MHLTFFIIMSSGDFKLATVISSNSNMRDYIRMRTYINEHVRGDLIIIPFPPLETIYYWVITPVITNTIAVRGQLTFLYD